MRSPWTGLRSDQRKQMATAFKEFENIFEGNRRTIDYIDALETKVKAGQGVSKAEVEKLSLIATGISFPPEGISEAVQRVQAAGGVSGQAGSRAADPRPQCAADTFWLLQAHVQQGLPRGGKAATAGSRCP